MQYLFIGEILFAVTITIVKISILCFYRTIFSVPKFGLLTWTVGVVCLVWLLISLFITIFHCNPIQGAWDVSLRATGVAKCLSMAAALFGLGIANVVNDILILALPIYMVQQLQMKTPKKISIIAIFLMGGL
jgi:hypothetical protein